MTRGLLIRRAGLADVTAIWAIEQASFPTPWSRWSFLAELGHPNSHTLVIGPAAPHPWETWGYIIFWVVTRRDAHPQPGSAPGPPAPRHRPTLAGRGPGPGPGPGRRSRLAGGAALQHPGPSLYKSFGFREVGRRPRYYDDTQEDAFLLTLDGSEVETEN